MGTEARHITPYEASKLGDTTPVTVRRWCERHGIGEKVAGVWRVDPDKLAEIIQARAVLKRGQ